MGQVGVLCLVKTEARIAAQTAQPLNSVASRLLINTASLDYFSARAALNSQRTTLRKVLSVFSRGVTGEAGVVAPPACSESDQNMCSGRTFPPTRSHPAPITVGDLKAMEQSFIRYGAFILSAAVRERVVIPGR
jgi:hypothetical protein